MEEFITIERLLTSIFVAVPTAYLSVYLALKKYRTAKWWDNKSSCYLDTIAALNSLIIYCDIQIDVDFKEVSYTVEQLKTNETKFLEARSHLQAQVNLGVLLLNKVSYDAIFEFNNEFFSAEREYNSAFRIGGIREAAEKCIDVVVSNAKKDLGVK